MTQGRDLVLESAVRDFREARRKAALQDIVARITGKSDDLLSYEETRRLLKAEGVVRQGLQDIPLDAIVGSVGRYTDFTRSFLPRRDTDKDRWAKVKMKALYEGGLPPIEVYQIGEAYFVLDGNHRVSVARELGATHIQAYVTEVHAKVPLKPDAKLDDLIITARYAELLEYTGLDRLRPEADLAVTAPGRYRLLEDQIDLHRRRLTHKLGREVSMDEAVGHWYDHVYLPVVRMIRQRALLRDFPKRTETDLYVWICEHQEELSEEFGWEVNPDVAAVDVVYHYGARRRRAGRFGERLLESMIPEELESGPAPGQWRREHVGVLRRDHLFTEILVPIKGNAPGWSALQQALLVAEREQARVHGLHVVSDPGDLDGVVFSSLAEEFDHRCQAKGIQGQLTAQSGDLAKAVCKRARLVDLIVLHLDHPPARQPLTRLGSKFRSLLHRCSRPILVVTDRMSPFRNGLLAYDGSRKAQEALFVATYLARRWALSLTVVTVAENGRPSARILERAANYLESHQVEAVKLERTGPVADTILETAVELGSDLLIMGGYGFTPVLEVVLGSAVDQVLRCSEWPVLVCR